EPALIESLIGLLRVPLGKADVLAVCFGFTDFLLDPASHRLRLLAGDACAARRARRSLGSRCCRLRARAGRAAGLGRGRCAALGLQRRFRHLVVLLGGLEAATPKGLVAFLLMLLRLGSIAVVLLRAGD